MTLSLRDRRRLETARDIQQATLKLAVADSLDAITTEAIAAAAGISTRTFFNYFPNKEAAAIGTPPGFRAEDKDVLCAGRGSLADDLKQFLDKHMATLADGEDTLRMVRKIIYSNPRASSLLDQFHKVERDELTECLRARVKDEHVARALAENAVACTSRAIRFWENQENISLKEALDTIWSGHIAAAGLLIASLD